MTGLDDQSDDRDEGRDDSVEAVPDDTIAHAQVAATAPGGLQETVDQALRRRAKEKRASDEASVAHGASIPSVAPGASLPPTSLGATERDPDSSDQSDSRTRQGRADGTDEQEDASVSHSASPPPLPPLDSLK